MDEQSMREMYRFTQENNKMLHAMRRNSFIWGLIRLIFYVFILVVAPLWIYTTYLQPLLQNMTQTMHQVQGTGASVQTQLNAITSVWNSFVAKLPAFMQPKQ